MSPIGNLMRTAAFAVLLAAVAIPAVAETTLSIATLAPERSAWDKVFKGFAKDVEKATGGSLKIKLYNSGVQGDEEVVVLKMKSNQVDGAAVTGVGLGKISPNVLVLQLPMLFDPTDTRRGYKQLDHVRERMRERLEKEFLDKGFVLIGWGDVGFAYVFSNTPVAAPGDIRKAKMWTWSADPIASAFVTAAGGNPIPLSVPDVMPNLETGLIDAFYASPLAAIALRWFTKVKYMTADPIAVGIGATVVSKGAFDRLSAAEQQALLEAGDKWHKILVKKVRADNDKSIELLQQQGVQLVPVPAEHRKTWSDIAAKVEKDLTGKVYDATIIQEVRKHLASAK